MTGEAPSPAALTGGRPWRILFVHHAADLGGASLSMLGLIDQLERSRYVPSILFNCSPKTVLAPFLERGIPTYQEPSITTYPHAQGAWLDLRSLRPWEILTLALSVRRSAARFKEFLDTHPFDLVHLNSLVQIPAAIGAGQAGLPVVWHVREELHPGYFGLRRAWVRHCVKRYATRVVAISRQNASLLPPGPPTTVVYNFVDFGRFRRDLTGDAFRRSIDVKSGAPLVAMLGGVLHSKGADILVEAAARVRRRRPDVVFLIAGLPPAGESPSFLKRGLRRLAERSGIVPSVERRVQDLIARHSLDGAVRLLGLRSDIPEMLAASRMLVWPATVSHFARPIIEAGAMGLPVVASDFPSSREVVIPGTTGILVPPGDADALSAAILRLLETEEEAKRMGEAGHALARERYDARRNAAGIVALYEAVLGEKRTVERE